ncbi:HAD-IA family hydrolase [Mangrovicoccus algicola]|uniref:HAD-IA family hydrolase n=1 Tax=Mangrovicoccus algicola TaxID=2771008 RepID=A0A8J6YX38_9RHOB|nr:HAD-IA family hydrolase [Mangrovicoccus algicola]MBE3637401.1 HAD-IA family hydrolase [Mangrovicoccus algicola]
MSRLRLALFDVDGTLVDSQGHIKASMAAAFAAEGLAPPPDAEVLSIVGLSLPNAIAQLAPDQPPARIDRMVAAYKDSYAAMRGADAAASSPLYPGALACLDALAADDHVLIGVATGKSRRGLTHLMDLHGLAPRFVTTQVADDHPSKPHPAMVEAALAATGVAAADAVMIGDTSFDMEMGRAAGVRRLGVAWGYHAVPALEAAGAERLATEFAQVPALLHELWGE